MDKSTQLYVEEFKEWLNEQNAHAAQLEASIVAAEQKKISNQKQLALHQERINIHIKEFNLWAKEHGVEPIELI